jgi:hypothetical protein
MECIGGVSCDLSNKLETRIHTHRGPQIKSVLGHMVIKHDSQEDQDHASGVDLAP